MWYSVGLGHPHNATKQLVCWDLKARINLEVPNMCGCCSPRELLDSLTCDKATHASKKQRLEPDNADLYVVFLQLQNTVPTSISIESLCRTAFKCGLLQRSFLYIFIYYYHLWSITVYHWNKVLIFPVISAGRSFHCPSSWVPGSHGIPGHLQRSCDLAADHVVQRLACGHLADHQRMVEKWWMNGGWMVHNFWKWHEIMKWPVFQTNCG